MDLGRAKVLFPSSLPSPPGQGWIGGPVVLAALETGLEKPHPAEDPGLSMAPPSLAVGD